jgi:hypothetical protein
MATVPMLTPNNAVLTTAPIEVAVLRPDKRQVTAAVFRLVTDVVSQKSRLVRQMPFCVSPAGCNVRTAPRSSGPSDPVGQPEGGYPDKE